MRWLILCLTATLVSLRLIAKLPSCDPGRPGTRSRIRRLIPFAMSALPRVPSRRFPLRLLLASAWFLPGV